MNSSPTFLTQKPARKRWASALLLAAVTLLVACGGQSSGTAGNGPQSGQNGSSDSNFAMSGAYKGTTAGNNSDFLGFITPGQRLYGIYALKGSSGDTITYPILYSGKIDEISLTGAKITALNSYQYPVGLRSGNALLAKKSTGSYGIQVNGLALPAPISDPNFTTTYLRTTDSDADLSNPWTGTWTDSRNQVYKINSNLVFQKETNGTFTSAPLFGDCTSIKLTLTRAEDATTSPYFLAEAVFNGVHSTGCKWVIRPPASATLTGVGFLYSSTPATQQLEVILTDNDGRGIVFRGEK